MKNILINKDKEKNDTTRNLREKVADQKERIVNLLNDEKVSDNSKEKAKEVLEKLENFEIDVKDIKEYHKEQLKFENFQFKDFEHFKNVCEKAKSNSQEGKP
jgi:hypothetical protein